MLLPLSVGDIHFGLTGELPPGLLAQADPDYTNFEQIITDTGNLAEYIHVCLKYGELPDLSGRVHLYDGGDSWEVYQDDNGYLLSNTPSSLKQPIWVVSANHDFSDVIVHLRGKYAPGRENDALFYPLRYPLDQILLMHYLGTRDGLIVHSAGLLYNNRSYIFPGISGAGKTTLSTCLSDSTLFNQLSDDRMIVRMVDNTIRAYGTPWPGDGKIAVNDNGKLGGMFFLNKAPENRVQKLSPQEAFHRLMPVVSIPWYNKDIVMKAFDFCEYLVQEVPAYDLYFHPAQDLSEFLAGSFSRECFRS